MSHSDEIRKMLRESGIEPQPDLRESEIACAVADAWADAPDRMGEKNFYRWVQSMPFELHEALNRVLHATRGSALRKVTL